MSINQPLPLPALAPDTMLIETMGYDPQKGVPMIEFHLERLKESASELGFECDRHAIRNEVQAVCFTHREPARLKIELQRTGRFAIRLGRRPAPMAEPVPVSLVTLDVQPGDPRLRHKTSERDFYDAARRQAAARGAEEAILVRPDGMVTEGSFTSVFVERGDMLLTPPLGLGLLPGVLRRSLIEDERAKEAELRVEDLDEGLMIGNSLRGLMRARLIAPA
ncbi:aminotransferase class IV [Croceicoccus marinus]|uniref:aminotransferase class IV n=1 Tax=Croceicoccus marinus TaxID=450378 RepID=UPI0008337AD9|nr:aminotransferase class IV [Croceicoccus marinus]